MRASSATPVRHLLLWIAVSSGLFVSMLLALKSGAVPIRWSELFAMVGVGADLEPFKRSVFLELRLPRVLFAAVAGGALALSGAAMQALVDESSNLSVMTLEPGLEQLLHNVLQQSQPGQPVVLEPNLAENLFNSLRQAARDMEEEGHAAVLVVSPLIRGWLSKAVRFRVNDLTVLSYSEIPDDQAVKVIHTVNAMNRN